MIETFLIYSIGVVFGVFGLYFLGISLAPHLPSKMKNEHFECGLPASASTPKKANFGFFVYAILFIVADMTALFVALEVYGSDKHSSIMASIFVLIMAISISLGMRELEKDKNVKNS